MTRSDQVIEPTQVIPAKLGSKFGLRYTLAGKQVGDAPLTLLYLTPGVVTPDGLRHDKFVVQQPMVQGAGADLMAFEFSETYEVVPGEWRFMVFQGDRLILGHIGDSRCYRLRAGVLQQITRDHSWLQEQVDAGILTREQAAASSSRNLVTRALGVEPNVQMEVNEFQVAPSDLFVMCSDGLTDMVNDDDLAQLMRTPAPLEEKAALLIDTANAHGGRDNVSVLLVQAAAGGKKRSLMSRLLGSA